VGPEHEADRDAARLRAPAQEDIGNVASVERPARIPESSTDLGAEDGRSTPGSLALSPIERAGHGFRRGVSRQASGEFAGGRRTPKVLVGEDLQAGVAVRVRGL